MCAYLQYINVYVYDMHIIEKNFQWEFSLESHGRCVGKQFPPLLNTWSFQNPHLNWTGTTVYLDEGTLVSLFHQLNQGTTVGTQNH